MRVMLLANIHPPARFANGATGRLLSWEPAAGRARKPVPANDDRVCARFCHESSVGHRVRLPGVDWIDVTPRQESAPHEATRVQRPLGPAYALVLHKVQSLTMPGQVLGCLQGIFAHGQVYVLISRVTDPRNFCLLGLPPADLLDEVAEAWAANGFDVDASGSFTLMHGETFTFTDGVDLAHQLAESTQVRQCYVLHWARYATGVHLTADHTGLSSLQDQFQQSVPVEKLIVAITGSDLFRYRHAGGTP